MSTEAPARSQAPPSLMGQLKAETADLHARIEEVVPLLRPGFDLHAYRRYLERLAGYLGPLEERLRSFAASFAAFGIDLEARRKTGLILDDLRALGAHEASPKAAPGGHELPSLPSLPSLNEAWGCLYVIEGSTLGGRVLLRALGPRLQLEASRGLGFLAGYGEQTGASWSAFVAATGRFDEGGCDRGAVVRGARATFSTQMAWLAGEA